MFSFPVSLILGVTGIIFDRRKWVAIAGTFLAALPMIVMLYWAILRMVIH